MESSQRCVLLVQLPIPPVGPEPVSGNVPLAAALMKLFAERQGLDRAYAMEIFPPHLAHALGDEALVEAILSRQPWMVGFSCFLWNIERTLWVIDRLRARRPDLKIILGGPEITPDNAWVLRSDSKPEGMVQFGHRAAHGRDENETVPFGCAPLFDYAVFGDGEMTFAELLTVLQRDHEPRDAIAGLYLPGRPMPPKREPLAELDRCWSPYLAGMLGPDASGTMLLETARGCRFRCKYCYYPKGRKGLQYLSRQQIAANLRYADQQGVREIYLLDPTLNQRPHFGEFLRLLAEGNPRRGFTFSGELRAEGIDSTTARLLRQANFHEVEIGLQSINPLAQKLMGRGLDLAAFERGVRAMLDEGIKVRLDLIFGLPGDTPDTIRRGIDYLEQTRIFTELQIFQLSILPGTAFRDEAGKLGLEYQARPPYYVLQTPTLDREEMSLLMDEAQQVFGIDFDPAPPVLDLTSSAEGLVLTSATEGLVLTSAAEGLVRHALIDLDHADGQRIPPPERRGLAFTLWLRAIDFRLRQREAAQLVRQFRRDNPHSTLQIVVEPANPASVTSDVLDDLAAACHEHSSYLDWFYSMHPGPSRGATRVVLLVPLEQRSTLGPAWADEAGQSASIVWWGGEVAEELMEGCEYAVVHRPKPPR